MNHPDPHAEQLVALALAGVADAAQLAELNALLATDDALLDEYIRLMKTDAALHWQHGRVVVPPMNAEPIASLSPGERAGVRAGIPVRSTLRLSRPAYALAAALLLAAAAVAIYVFVFNSKPETPNPKPAASAPLATVTETLGGTLLLDDAILNPGDEIGFGTVALDAGSADFRQHNGVGVTLRGDTRLTLHDPMHATLDRGWASFTCPHAAVGYTVHLPGGARVVDLGTAFTVHLAADGSAFVEVTEGVVELSADGRTERITADHAGFIDRSSPTSATPEITVGPRPARSSDDAMAALDNDPRSYLVFTLDGGEGQPTVTTDRFGRPGRAARFDGARRIDLHRPWPADEYTVAAWVRPDAFADKGYVIGVQNSGYNPGRFLRLVGDRPQFTHVVSNKAQPEGIFETIGPVLPAGRWTHLAATFLATGDNAGMLTLYVNGRPVDQIAVTGNSSATAEGPNLTIGARPDRTPTQDAFVGSIDDAAVIARPMSDQEIENLYEAGRPSPLDDRPFPPAAAE